VSGKLCSYMAVVSSLLALITLFYAFHFIMHFSVHCLAIPAAIAAVSLLLSLYAKRNSVFIFSLILFAVVLLIYTTQIAKVSQSKKKSDLELAILYNDLDLMKRKIAEGYDVNGTTLHGDFTMLMYACNISFGRGSQLLSQGYLLKRRGELIYEMLKILLDNGAHKTVNTLAKLDEEAPLHYVSSRAQISLDDQLRIIDLLLSYGADINLKDGDGRTPLNLAVYQTAFYQANNLEAVKHLVEKGADVNMADKEGKTPLKIALERDKTKEIADFLRQHGAKE